MTIALYYTPPAATDLDHILTILGRILTMPVRVRPLVVAYRIGISVEEGSQEGTRGLSHFITRPIMRPMDLTFSALLVPRPPRFRRCLGIDDGKPFCLNQTDKRTISPIDVSNHLRPQSFDYRQLHGIQGPEVS